MNACKKIKESLQVAIEVQQKYVELPEFKKGSCLDIDRAIQQLGKQKLSFRENNNYLMSPDQTGALNSDDDDNCNDSIDNEQDESLKLAQRVKQKRRRKFTNSFFNASNLVQWEENPNS